MAKRREMDSDTLEFKYGSNLDHWRICDELNIVQIALLISNLDPGEENLEYSIERMIIENQPVIYKSSKTALINAVTSKRLPARIGLDTTVRNRLFFARKHIEKVFFPLTDENFLSYKQQIDFIYADESYVFMNDDESSLDIDIYQTKILVNDLKYWLDDRAKPPNFFFPEVKENVSYLDPSHFRFSAKLAAAVRAWQAVEDPAGRSPKAALEKWLRENAAANGLTDRDGKLNEQGIQECAKVANWETKGGAPKTPSANSPTAAKPSARKEALSPSERIARPDGKGTSELLGDSGGFDEDDMPF